jgi:hypothetical protein
LFLACWVQQSAQWSWKSSNSAEPVIFSPNKQLVS